MRRIQPQVAGQEAEAEFLARDESGQRLVDAQHVGGLGIRRSRGVVRQPVDDAGGIAQPAQHLDDQRQHLGFALAQALLLQLFALVFDGAQFGAGAAAVLHLAAA
ncbi:hypothetical protein G6F63_016468 [Rhizopus arrhizus]|nr:hypothetical protein G6F63_016468 [Rhizopus arrhizus]